MKSHAENNEKDIIEGELLIFFKKDNILAPKDICVYITYKMKFYYTTKHDKMKCFSETVIRVVDRIMHQFTASSH